MFEMSILEEVQSHDAYVADADFDSQEDEDWGKEWDSLSELEKVRRVIKDREEIVAGHADWAKENPNMCDCHYYGFRCFCDTACYCGE